MAITTPKIKSINTKQLKPLMLFLTVNTVFFANNAHTQEVGRAGLNLSAQASGELTQQNIDRSNDNTSNLTTLTVTPQLNATYISSHFTGSATGTVTRLERSNDSFSQENTYAEYSYVGTLNVIDQILTFRANGALSFQNASAGTFLTNDFLNDQGQLLQTRSNTLTALVSAQNGDWVRGNSTLSYSKTGSDQNELLNNQSFDANIYSAQAQIFQGDQVEGIVWNVTGSYSKIEQDRITGPGDFETRIVSGSVDFGLFGNWALRVNGQHEGNDVTNLTTQFSDARRFTTYGGGITYRSASNRFLAVTYNVTESDIENQDDVEFIGVDLNWAFSARTSIAANVSRRFFGDSANVSLNYNTKHFRSSVTYTEQVTSNSLLSTDLDQIGLFVCPLGTIDISSCFQPDSLNFAPAADELFVAFNTVDLEVNNNITLRQASNAQIGYSFSRLNLALFSAFVEETFLDNDARRTTATVGTSLSYQLGAFTSLTSRVSYAEIDSRGNNGDGISTIATGESDNLNARIGLTRQLGRNLSASTNITYIDSAGTISNTAFGGNFTDRRISLSIVYQYD